MNDTLANSIEPQIPVYKCHKEVRAFKIGKIEGLTIYSEDGGTAVEVDAEFITKYPLNLPGYFVIYADGYRSFSPAKAFEEGYTPRVSCGPDRVPLLRLLRDANAEIRGLRQSNSFLRARTDTLDLVERIMNGGSPRVGMGMCEDILGPIERTIRDLEGQAEAEKRAAG